MPAIKKLALLFYSIISLNAFKKNKNMQTIRKRFDIKITEPDKNYAPKFELDKTAKYIKGILITSDREDLLFYRGEQKIEINGREHFPENYESKLLMTSLNVPANSKYYDLKNLPSGTGIIKFDYKDVPHSTVTFSPYRVSLYVEFAI
jgi:hypothetical protein